MSSTSRWGGRAAAAIVGVALGTSVMLAANSFGDSGSEVRSRARKASPPVTVTPSQPAKVMPKRSLKAAIRPRGTILAWAPLGTPADSEQEIEKVPRVREATTVRAGLDWIKRTRSRRGDVIDRAPRGL